MPREQLTSTEVKIIKNLKKSGMSQSKIAAATCRSRTTVRKALQRRSLTRKAARTPKKLAARQKVLRSLAVSTRQVGHRIFPAFGGASCLRAALHARTGELISVRQVQRDLHSAGLTSFKRPKVPTRNPPQLLVRQQFAQDCLAKSEAWFRRLVFSDETWISCNEATNRWQWAPTRQHVLPMEAKSKWNVPSVLCWAAVGIGWRSPLIIFPAKMTEDGQMKSFRLDAAKYVRSVLAKVVPDLVRRKSVFQQDGARCHMAKSTIAYLRKKGVILLECWPPYSPDFSPIESVWPLLKDRIGQICPLTTAELIRAAKKAWSEIPQAEIDRQVASFASRLRGSLSRGGSA